ncbi:cbb3-type cytochrome c oxidase subunit I [Planctomyces sp. SH-PL14]|uniref:cytochrome c oxidase subunit I n=1 Tax=Planctomyces sp. SH-PL14 TaxID=1632864 RepID=UPI00078CED26|nr:cbb3-type cytochrome c oxidase subunit I [Planctomyces sp. SH-PL14]AMV21958.1 Alternative cytochrome c oxidase subunit 1 [Planctomyces sp. SH-PL14]
MSSIATHGHGDAAHAHGHVHHHNPDDRLALLKQVWRFSTDHKVIGIQFLLTTVFMLMVGGALALGVRWQLAFPWENMPIFGAAFAAQGGQISPEAYTMLFTMHATVMIFLVIIPILAGAFGNFLIPLMIGADDMAFPILNALSYWFMWPAIFCFAMAIGLAPDWLNAILPTSLIVRGGIDAGAAQGWTSYPVLSALQSAAPGSEAAQTWWLLAVTLVGVSSMMGSVNYMTTIINMRAPGMTLFRMPLTIWSMFITAILQSFALPVLTAAGFMLVADRLIGTCFFIPAGLVVNNAAPTVGGGQPLLWQHLFWFYSHPAVYIMLLPAMGMVSDMLACMSRKPIFGYKPMVYSMAAIAGLGFIVWGHHMFTSGMNPALGMTFMVSTIMIALPSAVKVFNWIGTIWGGRIRFNTVMLNSTAFVSMFIVGGLSGIFMAAVPVDIYIHDTYFIVAHFHYVLFGATLFGCFGAIVYWFPKMFGRMMNETLGQWHFALSFMGFNGTFFPMHLLGVAGMPRRYANPFLYPYLEHLLPMNQFMTICAIVMGFAQFLLIGNMVYSMFFGPIASRNPWDSNGLEWDTPSPPGHGNFETPPLCYRGPYEYSDPSRAEDFWPQTTPPVKTVPQTTPVPLPVNA